MKKLKKIVIAFTTLALVLTLGVSSMMTAFAASGVESLFGGTTINFKSTAYYGETVDLTVPSGVDVVVTAPNGKTVALTDGKFDAAMVGYYTVSYSKNGGISKYNQFKIYVSLKDTWTLEVDKNGASIPTYVKMSSDTKITLPSAKAVVYDEDGEVSKTDANVVASVIGPDGKAVVLASNAFAPAVQGTYFVRYTYTYSDVSAYALTKDFKIQSQKNFEDTEIPTIAVNNPDSEINVNVGYTLPKATPSDNFDANVEVIVTVTAPDKTTVYQANVNKDYDYATSAKTDAVVFDNNGNMKFYPMQTGEYAVKYQAKDDNGNMSTPRDFTINVVDKLAPVITVDETAIPYSWGNKVIGGTEANPVELADTTITFPYPTVVDNSSVVSIGFSIKNSKNVEVINFSDLTKSKETEYKKADGTKGTLTFSETAGLVFDFESFQADPRNGDYTVSYTAKDAKNTATKSYTINYSDKVEDFVSLVAAVSDFPSYITVDDEDYTTYTIPKVSLTETASKNRTQVKTYLVTDGVKYVVEEGDEIKFTSDLKLTVDGASEATTVNYGKDVVLQIWAKNHAGNEFNSVAKDYTAEIINKDAYEGVVYTFADNFNVEGALQNVEQKLGGFTISANKSNTEINYDYVGFELVITDPNGSVISKTSSDIVFGSFTNNKQVLSVSDIRFTPGKAGTYLVTVKAFDVSGNAAIVSTQVEVAANDDIRYSSDVNWPAELTQGKVYTLEKLNASYKGQPLDVTIHVEGALYSMSAKQFTANAASTYDVTYSTKPNDVKTVYGQFTFTANDSSKPGIEIAGTVPVYSALSTTANPVKVVLPDAVGIALTGIKTYTTNGVTRAYQVEVHDKNNELVTLKTADGQYYFEPTLDGKYTVKYTVNGNNDSATFSFTMSAGDIASPDFKLSSEHATTAKLKDNFKFVAVSVDDAELNVSNNETLDDLTFTKKIVAPDGTEYTVSGKGKDYAEKLTSSSNTSGYELTQSGTYHVTYTVTDKAGNVSTQKTTISVAAASSNVKVSTAVISTILVIVGVLLLVGVGIFLWKGRPIKEDN